MHLLIISGRSGSGKTVLLNTLEDLGFYCVDNLPLSLLPALLQALESKQVRLAVGIDARNFPEAKAPFKDILGTLQHAGHSIEILYLDADDSVLVKRFSETRRKHPLTHEQRTLPEALQTERALLAPIADMADLTIDTTSLTKPQLGAFIRERVQQHQEEYLSPLQLVIQSFGFKYGLPPEVDFVFDARCLPNPYWELHLRPFSGLDTEVVAFLEKQPLVIEFVASVETFLDRFLPAFQQNNRSYLTVGIGCTGGQHRSVYVTDLLVKACQKKGINVQSKHRDLK